MKRYAQYDTRNMIVNLVGGADVGLPVNVGTVRSIELQAGQIVKSGMIYNAQTGEFTEPVITPVEPIPPQPTEQEIIQAELMLNQAQILANQQSQDEVLATILLEQARGQANV